MFLTDDDKRALFRHSLVQIREAVGDMLDEGVRHETEARLHGGVLWRLTARRVIFDYARLDAATTSYGKSIDQGLRDGLLLLEESRDVLELLGAFGRVSTSLLDLARRGMTSGRKLSSLADDDSEAPDFIGKMMAQELECDANVIERLMDVTGDAFPALYNREEFLDLQGFYADQPSAIAELAAAHKRFRGRVPEHMRREQRANLAKLKRNHARILRMLDKVFLMFE